MQVRREQFGQRGGDGFERRPVTDEMHIGFDREARRRKNALGRFHVSRVEPEPFRQLEPALDAAFGADIAVVVLDAMPPFETRGTVAKPRDDHRILDRDRALVIVAVQRPCLNLSLVELAAVQQMMERMQAVIACRADMAQARFQLFRVLKRRSFSTGES